MFSIFTDLFTILIPLLLSATGLYLAHNYRRQVRQKTTEGRIAAYSKLWEITKIATPMRQRNWHKGEHQGIFTLEERAKLYKKMTNWYYENGSGIFLGDETRRMYLNAKNNLLCPIEDLKPKTLIEVFKDLNGDKKLEKRSNLSIRQLSLLRHQMRVDLAVYGSAFFDTLTKEDKQFLTYCGVNYHKKHWKDKK